MKTIHKVLLTTLIFLATSTLFADPPPPPAEHGLSENQFGGGATIGSGLFILLGLGAAFGSKKIYDMKKKEPEDVI